MPDWRINYIEVHVELIKDYDGEAPTYASGFGLTIDEATADAQATAARNDEFRAKLRQERTVAKTQFTQLISTIVGQPKEKMRRF